MEHTLVNSGQKIKYMCTYTYFYVAHAFKLGLRWAGGCRDAQERPEFGRVYTGRSAKAKAIGYGDDSTRSENGKGPLPSVD